MTNQKSGLSTNSSFSVNRLILNLTEPFLWIHFLFYSCSLFSCYCYHYYSHMFSMCIYTNIRTLLVTASTKIAKCLIPTPVIHIRKWFLCVFKSFQSSYIKKQQSIYDRLIVTQVQISGFGCAITAGDKRKYRNVKARILVVSRTDVLNFSPATTAGVTLLV